VKTYYALGQGETEIARWETKQELAAALENNEYRHADRVWVLIVSETEEEHSLAESLKNALGERSVA
jgi:hypothetical protein